MRLFRTVLTFTLVAVAGCASTAGERLSSPLDPSNPDAAESANLLVPSFAAQTPASPAAAPPGVAVPIVPSGAGHSHLVCPMHPEVTSSKPDRCSKCGMSLEAPR